MTSTPLIITLPAGENDLLAEIRRRVEPYAEVSTPPPSFGASEVKLTVEIVGGASTIPANSAAIATLLMAIKDRFKQHGRSSGIRIGQADGPDVRLEDADQALIERLLVEARRDEAPRERALGEPEGEAPPRRTRGGFTLPEPPAVLGGADESFAVHGPVAGVNTGTLTYNTPEPSPTAEPALRYLHGRLPERARRGDVVPLQVRVALAAGPDSSTPLRAFAIPSGSADVKLVLDSTSGFIVRSETIQVVHVPPAADSDPVLFELQAREEGVHTVAVSAYLGGAFLGTLSMQITVDTDITTGPSTDRSAPMAVRNPEEGEVTLAIHYDDQAQVYRYSLRGKEIGDTGDILTGRLQRTRTAAVEDFVTALDAQAQGLTGYSPRQARLFLQGKGADLWRGLIPRDLQQKIIENRDKITRMTLLSEGDPIPWEALYLAADDGTNFGFLAELFPVIRWRYGPPAPGQLHLSKPFFVLPAGSPDKAAQEVATLQSKLGGSSLGELDPLLTLFDAAQFDLLHFACHNNFLVNTPTSSYIRMGAAPFVPDFLNSFIGRFKAQSPLVFINACRSDGMAPNYTQLAGWAERFLTAGAGAFVGSLWAIRDSSARPFAEHFYGELLGGATLGDAMKAAREAIKDNAGDPTWLAYTLYGNPAATIAKE